MMDDRARRNLNPHRSARMAMILYDHEYAAQSGGSMDFWDSLSKDKKRYVRDMVKRLMECPEEGPLTP
jgi:transcriptional regulator of met regulon